MVAVLREIAAPFNDGELLVVDGLTGDKIRSSGSIPVAHVKGTFDPTVTFATPGDVVISYLRQYGRFRRVGDWLDFSIYLTFTPTYTSASGDLLVRGLPFASETALSVAGWPLYLGSINNVVYQAGNLDIAARIPNGSDNIQLRFSTNAGSNVPATTAHFPSGVQFGLTIGGGYPIDA